jgi:hypothetical protein
MKRLPLLAGLAAVLAFSACSAVSSTLRYGADGQPEFFIDCSGTAMTKCYDRALELCPQGYFLEKDSQVPGGAHEGGVSGRTKHLGAQARDTSITWKNQVVVRCKQAASSEAKP